ncbi:RadC family protein [Basilea psittacipulmonis]|uniref:MPN domain-containing protein n=1 Tax=Basilea psittacipulmonis DSM 24701 TaxID=1072685 RepID=A0A077DH84_9BURK|nr:DNA repair protein RadC [Basilea psittacipulmonis]AIL32832.1 hypothetical protein IX83_05440 [Basilea psittacipulmonis DSM 24701]
MEVKQTFDERPRERLFKYGASTLTNAELLAVILGTGCKGKSVIPFSKELIQHFGSFSKLLEATESDLESFSGLGKAKIAKLKAINELAQRSLHEQLTEHNVLNTPDIVKRYCIKEIGQQSIEHCIALFLNASNQLICMQKISFGTIDETAIYPREIIKHALKNHAYSVILAHNHPSGSCTPSLADINITKKIKSTLQLVNIHLLDHIIVTQCEAISLAELGHLS